MFLFFCENRREIQAIISRYLISSIWFLFELDSSLVAEIASILKIIKLFDIKHNLFYNLRYY
ncbi:hypothetical protein DRI50_05600 [candidate division KSB1 bacterium]|nr:MAG: hypothetical protein DRI50_05600 [candidate division KSB1 bacterium]